MNNHFSIKEIAEALGGLCEFPNEPEGDACYGVIKLHIPLKNGKILEFRQGEDENDRNVHILTKEEIKAKKYYEKPTNPTTN